MKTKVFVAGLFLVLTGFGATAQENINKNSIFSYQGEKKMHTIGVCGGLSYSYSPMGSRTAYWLGAEAGIVLDKRWTIGYAGYALNYDKNLDKLVTDGTYRMEGYY